MREFRFMSLTDRYVSRIEGRLPLSKSRKTQHGQDPYTYSTVEHHQTETMDQCAVKYGFR